MKNIKKTLLVLIATAFLSLCFVFIAPKANAANLLTQEQTQAIKIAIQSIWIQLQSLMSQLEQLNAQNNQTQTPKLSGVVHSQSDIRQKMKSYIATPITLTKIDKTLFQGQNIVINDSSIVKIANKNQFKNIPFAKNNNIYAFNLQDNTVSNSGYQTNATDFFLTSADWQMFAFQDKKGNFYIANTGMGSVVKLFDFTSNNIKLKLTARFQAMAWGKDGNRMIFTIVGNYPEMGGSDTTKKEDGFWHSVAGLYVVDFNNKEIQKILISGFDDQMASYAKYVALDNDIFAIEADNKPTKIIDLAEAKAIEIPETNQLTANYNGDYALLKTTEIGANMSLACGKLLDGAETIFATSKWAETQWPVISPNGKIIAYTYSASANNDAIMLYDVAKKTKTEIIQSRYNNSDSTLANHWVDDEKLIFTATGSSGRNYYIYNLADKTISLINR